MTIKQDLFNIDKNDRGSLAFAVPQLLVVAGDLTSKVGDNIVFGAFDLTTSKYILLHHLLEAQSTPTMSELKEHMFKSHSNMTQAVDALEKTGLVRREQSPTDRRAYLIAITDKGRKLMEDVDEYFRQQVLPFMEGFTTDELSQITSLLIRVVVRCAELLNIEPFCQEL